MSNFAEKRTADHSAQNKMDGISASTSQSFSPPAFQLSAAPVQLQDGAGSGLSPTTSQGVVDHFIIREGRRNVVYLDSEGLPTVGIGHLLVGQERAQYPVGTRVSDEQVDAWFRQDSQNAYAAALQQVTEIGFENQALVDALTAVNFQSGIGWHHVHTKTWGLLVDQNWAGAAREVGDSLWFQQTPQRISDFQRVLLTLAGQPTDYESMRAFNADWIEKWGVNWDRRVLRTEFDRWSPDGHAVEGGSQSSGGGSGLSGRVGLSDEGNLVGSNGDTRKVQQFLVNAGFLPATRVNRAGETVSNVDGYIGDTTVNAIRQFQAQVVGMSSPDGAVDPGGRTWQALQGYTSEPAPSDNAPSGGLADPAVITFGQPLGGSANDEVRTETGSSAKANGAVNTVTETTGGIASANSNEISGPVGQGDEGFIGNDADTRKVQGLLVHAGFLPDTAASRDGDVGPNTVEAIKRFQREVLGFSQPDGRVDPGGNTWNALVSHPGGEYTAPETSSGGAELELGSANSGGNWSLPEIEIGFDEIPEDYKNANRISGSVGSRSGNNAPADVAVMNRLVRALGFNTETLNANHRNATKRAIQMSNIVYHFQLQAGLTADGRCDPNGATWRKLIEASYAVNGGSSLSEGQMNNLSQGRRGTSADVPRDIVANIGGGHLLGIDNSGFLLPNEFRANARRLKGVLETIQGRIGSMSISNGYRSPEHNVNVGSNSHAGQHVAGIAADIQWGNPGSLKQTLLRMMRAGEIPPGGVGQYSWGVHYDMRGSIVDFQ